MPASCSSRIASAAIRGVCSAGFATTALPAIKAAVTWPRKIASGKFQGEIATKTPRPRRRQHVALAGRSRHRLAFAKQPAALAGVIAAEVGGLAHFRERVVERLAALALQQRDEARGAALQEIGGFLQRRGPSCRGRRAPVRKSPAGGGDGRIDLLGRGFDDASDRNRPVDRAEELSRAARRRDAIDQGRRRDFRGFARDRLDTAGSARRARRIRCRANWRAASHRDRAAAECGDAGHCRGCR